MVVFYDLNLIVYDSLRRSKDVCFNRLSKFLYNKLEKGFALYNQKKGAGIHTTLNNRMFPDENDCPGRSH